MGCGTFVVKTLLFVVNTLVMLAGIALIVVGVLVFKHFQEYKELFDGAFSWFAIVILIIGSVICLTGFCGCCGAISENTCLLTLYGILMLLIFIVQVAIGVVVLTQVEVVQDFVTKNFETFFKQEYKGDQTSVVFDGLQVQLKCCGVNGPADYQTFGIFPDGRVSPACCTTDRENPATVCFAISPVHKNGCLKDFNDFITGGVNIAGAVTVGVAALEILAVIAACCLANHYRNK